jgi:signal transduction histidine kinase
VVVASVGAPGTPVPDRARLPADAPPGALGALAGRDTSGIGIGLRGERAILAAAHVTGASWAIVREIDEAEVLGTVRRGVLIEESLFSALAIALAILVRSGLRAVRLRREHEITRLRADFVSSVSHELRTPLAQIRMFAELLQRGGLRSPEEATRALRIIEKESSRLTILVDNVLNYARLRRRAESARVETLVPADVGDDVRQVLEAFAPLAAERGVRVVSTVPAGLYARIDSLALRQVLINYLENAVKYGPSGQTVTVGATAERDRVRVWVEDAGPGVPRAERELVWTAFQRGGSAEASGQGGSGIGLAVVRELVLQHGGAVAVETAAGGGARFVAEFQRATGVAG